MKTKGTGSESLILVLTPYEVQVIQMTLDTASSEGVTPKEQHAIDRVRGKTEKALAERHQSHMRSLQKS